MLREYYDRLVADQPVSQVKVGDELLLVCKTAIFKGEPLPDDSATPEPSRYGDHPMQPCNATGVVNLLPENLLLPDRLEFGGPFRRLHEAGYGIFPTCAPPAGEPGLWLLEATAAEGVYRQVDNIRVDAGRIPEIAGLPSNLFYFGERLLSRLPSELADSCSVYLMVARLMCAPTVMLIEGADMVYATMARAVDPQAVAEIELPDGTLLQPSRWSVEDCSFKSLVRKRKGKMKLGSPIRKEAQKTETAREPKLEVQEVGEKEILEARQAAETMYDEPAPEPVVPESIELPPLETLTGETGAVQEQPAADPDALAGASPAPVEPAQTQAQQEPQKERASKRKPVRDDRAEVYRRMSELVAQDAPEVTGANVGEVVSEIRALRDIGISILRRMANLTSALSKASESAISMADSIKAMVMGKK